MLFTLLSFCKNSQEYVSSQYSRNKDLCLSVFTSAEMKNLKYLAKKNFSIAYPKEEYADTGWVGLF
jgi:hypothetical protein